MKYAFVLGPAAAAVLISTACSPGQKSGSPPDHPGALASAATSPAHNGSITNHTASTRSGAGSPFCALARRIGHADLGVSSGNQDPDPSKLLSQVDQLDTLAPAGLKHDVDVFKAFEHSVLNPGNGSAPRVAGDTTAALEHVSSYFGGTCGVS